MAERSAIVVGAGVGGLTAALLLAAQGVAVRVFEQADQPGGKMRQLRPFDLGAGPGIDSGPTVFTMRWILEEIAAAAGVDLVERLNLRKLDVLARHAWGRDQADPNRRLDLFADPQASFDAVGRFAGAAEAKRFSAFCDQARAVYRTLEPAYIRSSKPSMLQMAQRLGFRGLNTLASLGVMPSLAHNLAKQFGTPELRQLFGRYATYCGASPWLAPATLMLVAQVELDGVWVPEAGMAGVAKALADCAVKKGATFTYGCSVKRLVIENHKCTGVVLDSGEKISADAVVFNGDVGALTAGLLGESARASAKPVPRSRRSLSALTWSIIARTEGFPLSYHNVFFDEDYASEFADIFEYHRLPRQATVYVCAQDRLGLEPEPMLSDRERLLCLVNAPAIGDEPGALPPAEVESCEQRTFALLARCGLKVAPNPGNSILTTPSDFENLFPATGGALYGQASHGWMTPFLRDASQSRVPGLFFAGGSVHPGPGVPMAAMSGRLAAACLMEHLDSINRSSRVAIAGGISMRSATTVSTDSRSLPL